MLTEAIGPLVRVNVPGFIVGRFWVTTEVYSSKFTVFILVACYAYIAVSPLSVTA